MEFETRFSRELVVELSIADTNDSGKQNLTTTNVPRRNVLPPEISLVRSAGVCGGPPAAVGDSYPLVLKQASGDWEMAGSSFCEAARFFISENPARREGSVASSVNLFRGSENRRFFTGRERGCSVFGVKHYRLSEL